MENRNEIYHFFRECLNRIIPIGIADLAIVKHEENYFHYYIGNIIDQLIDKPLNIKKRFAILYCKYMQARLLENDQYTIPEINKILTNYLNLN